MKKPEASLKFKIASEDWEFEAIHRLNYKTFVEEIPQHARNPEQRLVDKLHAENTYAICLHGDRLVGMVTARSLMGIVAKLLEEKAAEAKPEPARG